TARNQMHATPKGPRPPTGTARKRTLSGARGAQARKENAGFPKDAPGGHNRGSCSTQRRRAEGSTFPPFLARPAALRRASAETPRGRREGARWRAILRKRL